MANGDPLPIDRGWAWVITFATCGIFGFIAGSHKIRGIILVELQENFPDASPLSLIWLLNVSYLVDRIPGPIYSWILYRTSHRTASLLGTSIMTAGLIAFAYSPSIGYLYAAYAIYGCGCGITTLVAFTAYQPYFNKRKALSLGITGSGSGIYTVILSALLRFFFDNYNFSGAILLYAGVCLNTITLVFLLRPFSFYDRPKKQEVLEETVEEESSATNVEMRTRSWSVGGKKLTKSNTFEFSSVPSNLHTITADRRNGELTTLQVFALSAQDVFAADEAVTSSTSGDKENMLETKSNWKLIYHPRCIMLGLSILLHVSSIMAAFPCVPPLGQQTGVSKKLVSGVLAAGGVVEIVMRIANGWFADRKFISAYAQLTLGMLLTGISALLCAVISPYSGVAGILTVVVGVTSFGTTAFNLLPIVCGELFGKQNVPGVMGVMFIYQGLSVVFSSFGSGEIYERTKRWEDVFYFISASFFAASLLMVVTEFLSRCFARRSTS